MSLIQSQQASAVNTGRSGAIKLWLGIVGVTLFTIFVLWFATSQLVSWQVVGIAVVGVAIFAMLCFALSTTQVGVLRNRNVLFALWAVLIGSEEVFSYLTEDTTAGFSSGAYSEAMIWVFVTLAFAIYTIRHPQYLKRVYSGSFKWVSIFGTICLLSVSYAESKNYSLGWCYKMWLVIFLQYGSTIFGSTFSGSGSSPVQATIR